MVSVGNERLWLRAKSKVYPRLGVALGEHVLVEADAAKDLPDLGAGLGAQAMVYPDLGVALGEHALAEIETVKDLPRSWRGAGRAGKDLPRPGRDAGRNGKDLPRPGRGAGRACSCRGRCRQAFTQTWA